MPKFEKAKQKVRDFYELEGTCSEEETVNVLWDEDVTITDEYQLPSEFYHTHNKGFVFDDDALYDITFMGVTACGIKTNGSTVLATQMSKHGHNIQIENNVIKGYGAPPFTTRIKLVERKSVVKRLDEKFMPLLTDAKGVKYKITVSTSGTLSAVKVNN